MICKNCGNTLQENFCPECGEKSFHKEQLSFVNFVEETFEGFIHFDNKFFNTFKMLFTRPGQLSIDYTEGRRVKYMNPIQFFFIVNLLFFFFTINNVYNQPLRFYLELKPYTSFHTREIVARKLVKTKLSMNEYQESFDDRIAYNSKEFIFMFIILYGLGFYLFFFWVKHFFIEHLVFATHFISFVLLLLLGGAYLINLPYYIINQSQFSQNFENGYNILISVCMCVYLYFSIRKFYKPHLAWTIMTSLVMGGSFFAFVHYYRLLLFFKIVYLN